ncbi:hypothetical protein IR133_03775 [Staphylococcus saprophyticus]|uniref:hypothetical protein n=1 Tax=Staphylococcus xylosus TaxID=1288 RepID=UPI001074447B|nr:hypothetical protein [Staphylococcus xylosus]MBF0812827.1 hypothetical protein [Staphylococcus saprophyticus]TFV24450.1 hypothetical protein E4T75_03750 [Staphylococcus saprophyticus]
MIDYLDSLDNGAVKRICKEIYLNNNRTQKSLLNSLIGSKYDDEHAFLVIDSLCSSDYLDFKDGKMVDVGEAKQKLKDRGYL